MIGRWWWWKIIWCDYPRSAVPATRKPRIQSFAQSKLFGGPVSEINKSILHSINSNRWPWGYMPGSVIHLSIHPHRPCAITMIITSPPRPIYDHTLSASAPGAICHCSIHVCMRMFGADHGVCMCPLWYLSNGAIDHGHGVVRTTITMEGYTLNRFIYHNC